MKRSMILMAAGVCAAAAYRVLRPLKAHAWWSQTHEQITLFALERLEADKRHKLTAFYKPYSDELVRGSKAPDDEGDPDKGAGTHYYVAGDIRGRAAAAKGGYLKNRLGKYSKSARTSFEENYTSALGLYKSGRTEQAMYVLGRALHFVEDIAAVPHSAGIRYIESSNNVHYMFEKRASETSKKFPPNDFDKRLIKAYSEDSFEAPLNKLAAESNRYAPQISSLDDSAFDKATKALVPLAAQNAAAVLIRFYDDISGGNTGYLTHGGVYGIKNEYTGLYLTQTKKGAVLAKPDHSDEQRFTLIMNEIGAFDLKAADGNILAADLKSFIKPSEGKNEGMLRAAALGKNRFRLTVGKGYSCTVSGKRRSPTLGELVPGDSSQVWIIEKYK